MPVHRDIETGETPRPSERRAARSVVAVIGIDRYRSEAWPRLMNAVNDATGAAQVFKKLGFVEVTDPLLNEAATADAMRRLVTDDLSQLSSDDSLVLFFAGHGYTHVSSVGGKLVKTGCVLPFDARRPYGHISATWLQLDGWLQDIACLPPRHILVIVDACQSGVALTCDRWREAVTQPAIYRGALQTRHSRRIITSALEDQRASDNGPDSGHSLFTGYLIRGLSEELAAEGHSEVTGSQLGQYLQRRVSSYSDSNQTPDFGTFYHDRRGDISMPVLAQAGEFASEHEAARVHAAVASRPVAMGSLEARVQLKATSDELDRAIKLQKDLIAIDTRDYAAYRKLEGHYLRAGKWEELVETYRDHIMATDDVPTRVDLYVAMGVTCDQNLNDVERSIAAYSDALGIDPDEQRALDALGRLYEKIREWDRAIDMVTHLIKLTSDSRKQADLYWRKARIQSAELGDARGAEASLLLGLGFDPGHVSTMEALIRQYSERSDWLKAAPMMVRAERFTSAANDKARLLFDAARIYQDRLRQDDAAKQLYARVIALDPEHVEAGRRLADLYFAGQQWAELSPVIDMLCRNVGQFHADPRELNELYCRAAHTADELGDPRRALDHYKTGCEIDSTYLPALVGRADLLFRMQDFHAAGEAYQAILVQHHDEQGEADMVRVYNRLGLIYQALAERQKALHMFEKALEIDPTHRSTLEVVIELQRQQGDWEAVTHAMRGLMTSGSSTEKVQLLEEIGGIYHDKLQNPQKATAAYLEALEIVPMEQPLLRKILALYTETRQWKQALETIEWLIVLEDDSLRRATYYQAAGMVCHNGLKSLDEAVVYYSKALNSFFDNPEQLSEEMIPRALQSFEAIDRILTTTRDWKAQARAYRDMIERIPERSTPIFHHIQVGLFDGLGEIYRSRLQDYPSAALAYEIAQQLDPHNEKRPDGTDRAEILAELYLVAGPDYTDKAVEQHMHMLRNEPFKYDSYKVLRRIYMDTRQYDKSWCVCNALAALRKADPLMFLPEAGSDEQQFYEQHRPRDLVRAKNAMSAGTWSKLIHPDENRYISEILGAVWQSVAAMKASPHKEFGVKRKERRQLQDDPLLFSRLFSYVAQVLNVQLPEVYFVEDDKPASIQLVNAIEKNELCPSFVIRPYLLEDRSERAVAFLSARRLTFMRPEYYLKVLLQTNTELKVVVLSAIVMVQPRFPVPPDTVPLVQQCLPEMQKRMSPPLLEQINAVVARFIEAALEIDLARWRRAVDATSRRAGLVVCGDLEVAAYMVSAERAVTGGPLVKDKIMELILYSISEEYFAVRTQLGLTIAG